MCRRRLFKSNFYINYGGTKKAHGETVIVSPFVAGGDSDTFELYARNPWVITNNLSWLTVSSLSNKSGKYTITITAAENQAYSERSGSFTAKTLDNRFSIVVSVSQQAKPSVRYIEIVPATASISSLGTTSFTCILHDNGTETDVTNLVEWSSSDTNAATISNGSATGCNNTKTEKQVTITAEYDGLSATATLNVAAGVVSWRNYRILIGASENTKNSPVNLDATNITNGVGVGAYIDEYVNEVKLQTWAFTEGSDWSIGDDSIARLEKVSEGSRQVFSVYNDGAFYPDQRTTEITATTTRGTQTFTATKIVNVAPQGLITHYISVEPDAATIGSTGEVQLTVLYHTVIDGVDDGGVDVTTSAGYTDNGSDLIDVDATGKVNGSGAETGGNATVTVSYPDVESVNVLITVRNASTEEYLEITPASTSTTWNGEVEYSVYYVKKVNEQETTRVKITNPDYIQFTLSDDTAGKMNDFMFEAENISTSNKTVEISAICTGGTYSGIMTNAPANLTVNGANSVDYRLDVEAVPTSIEYSGSSQLYASAVTVVNGSVYKWYVPDDVVWNENSTAITIANGTVTGMHTGASSTTAIITGSSQSFGENGTVTITIEGRPEAALHVTRDNPTVSTVYVDSGAGQCNYYISWAYLKPGTSILLQTHNLDSTTPSIDEIQITDTNYRGGSMTIVGNYSENPSTVERDLYLNGTATTYYNETITGNTWYVQRAKETPSVITYVLEITPTDPGTKPYSGSQDFVATLYRLTNGTRDGWSENVTERVDWNISTAGGDFIKSGITIGGTAEWVNLSSSTGQVTVSAWLDEPDYGSPSSNEVVFTVNGVSITSTLTLTPATTTLDYGESVTYTATVTIRHDSTTVFNQTYTFDDWDPDVLSIAPDSNTYLTHDFDSKFDYSNASEQETSVTITCSYRETDAEFLPSGAHIDGTANVVLNEYVEPVDTYSVTFVCSPFAEEVSYTSTNGKSGDNHGVTNWTSTGFYDGDIISYTATKTGYDTVTGTATINGSDLTIDISFVESTMDLTIYYQKDTDDSRNYTVVTTLATTDGSWTKSMTGDTGSVDGGKTWKIVVPENQTGKTFTISFRQLSTTLFDTVTFGGPNLNGITTDSLAELNEALSSYTFDNLDYTALKFETQHILTGNITLDCSNATNYESVSILLNGNTIVTSTVPEPQSSTFTYTSAAQTFEIGMGSALGDGNRYKRFAVRIEDKNGNTLYDDTCRYLYPNSNPDYAGRTLTAAQLNGSVWYLYNLSNWGDITIHPSSPQTGVSGSTVSGNRSNVTIQINWSGLSNGTMTVSLPDNMTYDGSNTITIPINSSNGNVTRLVSMPANTGSVPTGSDITYTIRATATDVNSDTISGDGTIIHQYYYYSAPTIQLMESTSLIPISTGYTSVQWGQLTSDELEINIQCNDCSEIYIYWDSELEINMFYLTNATDSSGNNYVENKQTFYPTYPGGMVTLLTDVSKQISEASYSTCEGNLTLEGKNSYGDITTITISFAP